MALYASMGMSPDEIKRRVAEPVPLIDVWDDIWPSLMLFIDTWTQWRVGMAGRTGLDYSVLPAVFELFGIPEERRRPLFDDLRIMERAALDEMRIKAERDNGG